MVRKKQTARKSVGGKSPAMDLARQNSSIRPTLGYKGLKTPARTPARLSAPPAKGGVRRKHKPGQLAVKEITKYQKTTDLLVPRRPFSRLVREVCQEVGGADKRWKASALEALQEVAEAFVVEMLMDGKEAAEHAKRVTLMLKDLRLVGAIRKNNGQQLLTAFNPPGHPVLYP